MRGISNHVHAQVVEQEARLVHHVVVAAQVARVVEGDVRLRGRSGRPGSLPVMISLR
ncbi:MAG: hypothetical protein IPK19_13330 [Chloroflexi bacterium]|nr:hypothetical protein [Chloroflexota bacterium]